VQFLLAQYAPDEAVQARPRSQEDDDHDREARGEHRFPDREGAEKHGRHESDLGRQAGIAGRGAGVAHGHESADHHGDRHENELAAEGEAEPAGERRDGERADPRGRTPIPRAFPPLALDADEQADAERDRESDREAVGHPAAEPILPLVSRSRRTGVRS